MSKTKKKNVNFFVRMGTKIGYMVVAAVVIPIVILIYISNQRTSESMEDTYMSYAKNLAEEAATGVDFSIAFGEGTYGRYAQNMAEEVAIGVQLISNLGHQADMETLEKILGTLKLDGVESAYAYMVDTKGTMLYHPDKAKVGNSVENAAVKGIVEKLQAGEKVENGYTFYEYKDSYKLAGYALIGNQAIVIVTADYDEFMSIDYDMLIGKIEISGVEGSYAYMVDSKGTMVYHKDSEKIGQPVENSAVKSIVADLEAGKELSSGSIIYNYKGSKKVAGYALTAKKNIIVVTADYDTFLEPVNDQSKSQIILGSVMVVIFVIIGVVAVTIMMRAFSRIIPEIRNVAELNFTASKKNVRLGKRSDEIGLIAREISAMKESLRDIVGKITEAGDKIVSNVTNLEQSSIRVQEMCTDNSATSEELAAGMQETSATTSNIEENINEMKGVADDIVVMTNNGAEVSNEVMQRATMLRTTTEKATKSTKEIYSSVKVKSDAAIKASEAVNKINELTDTVMDISSQTGLLALNASIEAARAGEAGRGFAVVATEISSLATQTSTAVSDINDIIVEVNSSVKSMAECLREIIGFLEKEVMSDYENFDKVSIQYQSDANSFRTSMSNIKNEITNLYERLEDVNEAITAINCTVGESANGVSDIAGKTTDMVEETTITADMVDDCKNCVMELNEIMKKFEL